MVRLNSLAEAESVLQRYVPLATQILGKDITLERMQPLMKVLGDPQKKLKTLHIAGTSGKTSTSYFLANLLALTGRKVGLSVSPHVDSVTERVQINMRPISDTDFADSLGEFLDILETSNVDPSYFELLVAYTYWYFEKIGVDYAVIETGLGGLHDGTNVADNEDKICVITDIGIDHVHVLGSTVKEIALHKAGIIHPGNRVFMYDQGPEVTDIFVQTCKEKQADLTLLEQAELEKRSDTAGMSLFQRRNYLLAKEVFQYVQGKDNLPELSSEDLKKSTKVQVPGRMDVVSVGGKQVVMDGAHNYQKTSAFVASFVSAYPGAKMPILFSIRGNKEYQEVLELLKPITSKLIITEYTMTQDLPIGPVNANELADYAKKTGFSNIAVEPDTKKAYKLLMSEPSELVVITGSFYLISQLRKENEELSSGKIG